MCSELLVWAQKFDDNFSISGYFISLNKWQQSVIMSALETTVNKFINRHGRTPQSTNILYFILASHTTLKVIFHVISTRLFYIFLYQTEKLKIKIFFHQNINIPKNKLNIFLLINILKWKKKKNWIKFSIFK